MRGNEREGGRERKKKKTCTRNLCILFMTVTYSTHTEYSNCSKMLL